MELAAVILTAVISGVVSGVGAYMAIRLEIALLKQRMDRADYDRGEMNVKIDDAHERVDRLQRSRMNTI